MACAEATVNKDHFHVVGVDLFSGMPGMRYAKPSLGGSYLGGPVLSLVCAL